MVIGIIKIIKLGIKHAHFRVLEKNWKLAKIRKITELIIDRHPIRNVEIIKILNLVSVIYSEKSKLRDWN